MFQVLFALALRASMFESVGKDVKESLMLRTAVCSLFFSAAALGLIFYMTGYRATASDNIAQAEIADMESDTSVQDTFSNALLFEPESVSTNFLCIPLPPGIGSEAVTLENHYMNEEMWVMIREMKGEFYKTAFLSGNRDHVLSGVFEETGQGVILKFSLANIYEFDSILEGDRLYIEFVSPREMYDRIVVIDPAYGGSDTGFRTEELLEKDITLAIAVKLKEQLDQSGIKVYYTRMEDNRLPEEGRVRLANHTRADMLIRIEASADSDSMIHGTTAVYNEDFFIPGFGSIELANLLEQEVVSYIKGKAVGLVAATETDYVIREATVPAAAIRVGYMTNAQEAILLKRDDYIDKIATGIYRAILRAYEESL